MTTPAPDDALKAVLLRLDREPDSMEALFEKAQLLARLGRDEDAKQAFVDVLQRDPAHFGALTDLAGLALATGYRSAALTAYRQAVTSHPQNPFGLVNLANLLLEDGELSEARRLYETAIAIDPDLAYAHQGLASVLATLGDGEGAEAHREKGFRGHSIVARPFRGAGAPLRVLLVVSAKGGNIPTNVLLDDRQFAVTALYAEYHDPTRPLPDHDILFNAVGDADLCADALDDVARIVARSNAPTINRPEMIRNTGRSDNAARLAALPGIVVPKTLVIPRTLLETPHVLTLLADGEFNFPLLLRSPGFHTGQNFLRVENEDGLMEAAAQLPGDELFVIEWLDARGQDGLARKYRVMFLNGEMFPLHLALSRSWKVHYFTSDMAENPHFRSEEGAFLNDMSAALGTRAMEGLKALNEALAFDYGGVDFGLSEDGRLLLFEANATMAIVPPTPDPIWDYRRAPIAHALAAAQTMLFKRSGR